MAGGEGRGRGVAGEALSARQLAAAREFVRRVRAEVGAELVQASLFGSRARGEARPDSDVDVLLIFRDLPWDREPQATHAEELAEAVAGYTGVPVTAWSVSLVDLEPGQRTPMLVDAMRDGMPLWSAAAPLGPVPFTPEDARRCAGALLDRVGEGSEEVVEALREGDWRHAVRRGRDDLVRMCIALHLLDGVTRPRRGEAAVGILATLPPASLPPHLAAVLRWTAASYGPDGRDDEAVPPPPPGGLRPLLEAVDLLRDRVWRRLAAAEPGGRGRI